jgi:HlyD family secretion protein
VRGKWFWWAAAVVLLAIASAGGVALYRARSAVKPPAPPMTGPPPAAVAGDISLSGTIEAAQTVDVPVPVEGTIDAIDVEVGDEVFEGQLLARIRSTTLTSERDRAKEELESAQTRASNLESVLIAARLEASRASADATRARGDFERLNSLAERERLLLREGATPRVKAETAQKEMEAARAEYEALRERVRVADERVSALTRDLDALRRSLEEKTLHLEEAEAALTAADVLSPADGVVVAIKGVEGDEVAPSIADFVRISVDPSQLLLIVEAPPPVLAKIQPGMPAVVVVAEIPEPLEGAVREIRDNRAVVAFASPNPAVKPGMTAQLKLRLE